MRTYQPLTTEEYYRQGLEQQIADARQARNRKALRDFATFLFGLIMIAVGFYLGQQLPHWLPMVTDLLSGLGISNA